MTIRNDWGKITAAQAGLYEAVFRDTSVEPDGSGRMSIVFPNSAVSRFGADETAVKALTDYVKTAYQKDITFNTKIKKGGDSPAAEYVLSGEELKEAVHFPVDIVNEDTTTD
jgi:hypothetical protein